MKKILTIALLGLFVIVAPGCILDDTNPESITITVTDPEHQEFWDIITDTINNELEDN